MGKNFEYSINSMLIVPFRCGLAPSEFNSKFPNENFVTKIKLHYQDFVDLQGTEVSIQTKLCSIIEIQTKIISGYEKEKTKEWIKENQSNFIANTILLKINHFFNHVKYDKPNSLLTGVIRAIGPMDLLFVNLDFEGEIVFSRGISTLISTIIPIHQLKVEGPLGSFSVNVDLSKQIKKEWLILTRATDLVNHGYYIESMIIGYTLLEESAKKFFLGHIPNLSVEEASNFLNIIEKGRLTVYFGYITKLCFGESFIEDTQFKSDLNWLIKKRNRIIHEGQDCTSKEAQRGLNIVHEIIRKLNSYEKMFDIPNRLEFW